MLRSKKFWALAIILPSGLCLVACVLFIVVSGLGALGYNLLTFDSTVGVGRKAPDFELATLSGETMRLSQFQGQPVLLSFSATWCPDCQREAPVLQNIHKRYPKLVVLFVDSKESSEIVRAFADKHGLTFPIALDRTGKASDRYRIYAIPSVFLIDGQGVIRARFIERLSEKQVEELLATIGTVP